MSKTHGRVEKAPPTERWSFELRIRPHGPGTFGVHLLSSPAGDEVGELHLPASPDEMTPAIGALDASVMAAHRHLRPIDLSRGPEQGLAEIGSTLFQALFPEPILSRWDECQGAVGGQSDRGLRLLLKSDPTCPETVELHRLPWELLRDPRKGSFLALSRRTPIVRQLALDDGVVLDDPEPARRLRILAVLSHPPSEAPLDLDEERRTIEAAIAGRRDIELTCLENPTFGELTEALREGRFHVLHYMGHGVHDPASGEGSLFLTTADGMTTLLPAERLAQVIRDVDSIRLVVLNACETGRAPQSVEEAFTSLAHALVRGGVPAVLAMQVPIPDAAAIELSRVFYRHLAAGGSVDEALSEARIAIYAADPDDRSGAWAVPALFVRRPALVIFRPSPERPAGAVRHRVAAVALSLWVALVGSLFFLPAPWTGVELAAVETSRVAFTLAEPVSLIDGWPLAELAVADLAAVRHPDPTTGGYRVVTPGDVSSDRLGLLASAPAGRGGLTLDETVLPAGTRVEVEWIAPGALRLSLDLPEDERFPDAPLEAGPELTATIGAGATLRFVASGSEPLVLDRSGRLVLVPRAESDRGRRIDLDLVLADAGAASGVEATFQSPLDIDALDFVEVREPTTSAVERRTRVEEISTVTSGTVTLEALGHGRPTDLTLDAGRPISFGGLRGDVTGLVVGSESLRVAFRGRADQVTTHGTDGRAVDLMPTWSRTAWAVRLGAASIALAALLYLFLRIQDVAPSLRKESS